MSKHFHCSFKTFLTLLYQRISRASRWPWIFACSLVIWLLWRTGLRHAHKNLQTAEGERERVEKHLLTAQSWWPQTCGGPPSRRHSRRPGGPWCPWRCSWSHGLSGDAGAPSRHRHKVLQDKAMWAMWNRVITQSCVLPYLKVYYAGLS